jgi:hypothetical protein
MDNEIFINSEEYKTLKVQYEQKYFKVLGKYNWYDGDKLVEMDASRLGEHLKNKKVKIQHVEQTTRKGTTVSVSKELTKSFFNIWHEDPNMREYDEVVFNCNIKKVKPY